MWRKCPMCGGAGEKPAFPFVTVWNGCKYHYIRCRSCKSVFVDPVPQEADFALMYSKENYHDKHYREFDVNRCLYSVKLLYRLYGAGKRLLDFGCGTGEFLYVARQSGFLCKGVEYQPEMIRYAEKNSGVPVVDLDSLISSGEQFDVIHIKDVLVHLPEPESTFIQLRQLLAPKGLFFVEGPLENNPSLVYFSSIIFNKIKKALGFETIGYVPPTRLVRVNQKAQKYFFIHKLGLRQSYFELYETGWPYYLPGKQSALTVGSFIKRLIGCIAIGLSTFKIGNRKIFGNNFIGFFET